MREAELSPTCEYPLSRLPPVFLNRCGWVSYRFGGGFPIGYVSCCIRCIHRVS